MSFYLTKRNELGYLCSYSSSKIRRTIKMITQLDVSLNDIDDARSEIVRSLVPRLWNTMSWNT